MKTIGHWFRAGISTLAALVSINYSVDAAPRPPLPPWPELYLYQRSFDEPYGSPELAASALDPTLSKTGKTSEAPAWVESWSGYALNRQGMQVQPVRIPLKAENGYPLVAGGTGTVRFWFNPRWTSGQGPGSEGHLLEVVTGSGKDSLTWWTLRVSADGTRLALASQTEKGLVDVAPAGIQWLAGQWHLVTVVYTPAKTLLVVDAQVVAEGPGLPEIPEPAVPLSGLVVGSDAQGFHAAQGQFEELTTFAYVYPDWLLGCYYRGYRRQANLGPIRAVGTERGQTAAAATVQTLEPEPPGEGGGDTNCVVPVYPLATNGLRLSLPVVTNNTLTLAILGSERNAFYDLWIATNVAADATQWAWAGLGCGSNSFAITNPSQPRAFYVLAKPQKTMVVGWGNDLAGQCDVSADITNAVMVAGGGGQSLALLNNGTVRAWGQNAYGQGSVPTNLPAAKMIAAGWYHNVALLTNGVPRRF